ncbi:hypothetical protein R5N98_00410 [Tenacibaculum maritimum]|uniref:hypothetical protein n=1 Tax=Tenacibaculum maritimum TaxID=107401 RepID=UPI0010A48DB2|nr:hypothetical protein [Tenacibaculum maritimum]QCD62330.1 hypothetical protein B9C57_07150 [Tenacibaculum maritimum]CAA0153721.1 conserved hypothetical protein [Tenacibaculum maritimum]CAA0157355.1 conserved hypothetical protein [Tenacibaculum maritimum]CAA0171115.1 conserved hypothetical protein [Tenacibaculum maritimum]CAA0181303.1 conserved hypothetical protein [Tenacibaculum maritimum]
MALQITEKNGVFYLHGKINTTTVTPFTTHFEYMITQNKKVTINIDHVIEIDRDGLKAMKKLTYIASENHKVFLIIGYGCKDIYDDFNSSQVA